MEHRALEGLLLLPASPHDFYYGKALANWLRLFVLGVALVPVMIVLYDAGTLRLSQGGAVLSLPSGTEHNEDLEYPGLYSRFANLIRGGRSDVDIDPLRLVADAFLRGRRESVDAFYD